MGRTKRAHTRRAAWDTPAPWDATIDYRSTPFGTWTVTLSIADHEPVRQSARDAHEALHLAMDYLDAFVDDNPDCPGIASISMLDGDPGAWVALANAEGFLDCAQTGNSRSTILH